MGKKKTSPRQTAWLITVWCAVALVAVIINLKAAIITFLVLAILINLIKLIIGRDYLIK